MPVKQATAVLSAPGGEADRVQKMMSARPTLNANQRRSKVRQDISGASPDGTFVGRGGNTQQLGKAAMSRMPPPAAATAGAPPAVPDAEAIGLERAQRPAPLQGPALQDAMIRRGMPMPGGPMEMEGPGMGGQGFIPPPAIADSMEKMTGFGPNVQGGPGGAQQGIQMGGLPPQIMQRLQALRGIQAGRGPMAGAPPQRSFQDFWQGAGGAGQGNVAY